MIESADNSIGKLLVLYINAGSNGLTVVVRRQKTNEHALVVVSEIALTSKDNLTGKSYDEPLDINS